MLLTSYLYLEYKGIAFPFLSRSLGMSYLKRIIIIDLILLIGIAVLYYLGPLQGIAGTYPMISGIIIGIIIGFIPSSWSGHVGNKITEEDNKKSREAKQAMFINKLSAAARVYITSPPTTEAEVKKRKDTIAAKVKEFSNEIFGEDCPPIESIRPEETEYPDIYCKWCHRDHKAFGGPRGKCTDCCLPLDLWIGSQGETRKKL